MAQVSGGRRACPLAILSQRAAGVCRGWESNGPLDSNGFELTPRGGQWILEIPEIPEFWNVRVYETLEYVYR